MIIVQRKVGIIIIRFILFYQTLLSTALQYASSDQVTICTMNEQYQFLVFRFNSYNLYSSCYSI